MVRLRVFRIFTKANFIQKKNEKNTNGRFERPVRTY